MQIKSVKTSDNVAYSTVTLKNSKVCDIKLEFDNDRVHILNIKEGDTERDIAVNLMELARRILSE